MHELPTLDKIVRSLAIIVMPKRFCVIADVAVALSVLKSMPDRITYLIVIKPTPHKRPSTMKSFQNAMLRQSAQPVISGLCK